MRILKTITGILIASISMLAPAALFGQAGDTDVGEAAAFFGGAIGIGSHPVVGGSVGTAFSRYGMAVIETSFVPMGSHTVRVSPDGSAAQGSHLYDFNLGVHIRVPVRGRWAPYAILGGGLLWDTYTRTRIGPQGVAVVTHYGDCNFGFHTGGGLRYYVRESWGIRPEVKVVVSSQTYTQLSVGFFYVLPTNWP
jgi:hypothetical protein